MPIAMHPDWVRRLEESQRIAHLTDRGTKYARVRFGEENPEWGERPCACGATKGQYHVLGECEYERCPKCGNMFSEGHRFDCHFVEIDGELPNEGERPPLVSRELLFVIAIIVALAVAIVLSQP